MGVAAETEVPNRVRLTLELSTSLNDTLEGMARESGASKAEIIRKALALMEAANAAKKEGNQIGIINRQDHIVTRIVGL
jgi:metal-responsive CopG/Arc/MetJ family transcriptional regulator